MTSQPWPPTVQTLTIHGWLPEQLANGQHGHWSTRQRKINQAKERVWLYARNECWRPVHGKARLTIVLVFPNHRRRDADNLHSRVKGVVDGCKPYIKDDSTEWLELVVRAEVRPGCKQVELTLEPVA